MKASKTKCYPWMSNGKGGQHLGNRMEIQVLDELAVQKYILLKLRSGYEKGDRAAEASSDSQP